MTEPRAVVLVRRLYASELGMWRSLYRWIFRRSSWSGPDVFGYAAAKAPIIWAFIVLNLIEIPALHLILPWPTARYILDVLGTYSLIWLLGIQASQYVHPHLVGDSGLRIRNGLSVDFVVPWDAVAAILPKTRRLPGGRTIQFDDTGVLSITVMSQTNIDVILGRAIIVPLRTEPTTEVRCYADDPGALVALAQQHLAERTVP